MNCFKLYVTVRRVNKDILLYLHPMHRVQTDARNCVLVARVASLLGLLLRCATCKAISVPRKKYLVQSNCKPSNTSNKRIRNSHTIETFLRGTRLGAKGGKRAQKAHHLENRNARDRDRDASHGHGHESRQAALQSKCFACHASHP